MFKEENYCKKKLFLSIVSDNIKDFINIFNKCKNIKDIKNELGQNLLMFASKYKKDKFLKFLLDKNIFDINQQDNNGNTALILSAIENKEDEEYPYAGSTLHNIIVRTFLCIELLLTNKANEKIKNKDEETFEDIGMKLNKSYKFRENINKIITTQLFEELLKDNPDNLRPIYLITHGANVNGTIDHHLKNKLISEVPGDYYIEKYRGSMPLHFTTRRNLCKNRLITHALLANGANPNFLDAKLVSPLENAIKYNCTDVIKLLIKYGSKITKDCLHIAVEYNRIDAIKILIELGKLDIKDKIIAYTLVLYASAIKKYEFLRGMINLEADINTKDEYGYSALHTAVFNNNLDTVKELAKLGANINIKNKDYKPVSQDNDDPLSIAIKENNIEITKELLNLGVKITNYHVQSANELGNKPIVNILLEKLYKTQ